MRVRKRSDVVRNCDRIVNVVVSLAHDQRMYPVATLLISENMDTTAVLLLWKSCNTQNTSRNLWPCMCDRSDIRFYIYPEERDTHSL